jgi:RNA polymerase subunit RPABC4/transcription elongation factor Spt4
MTLAMWDSVAWQDLLVVAGIIVGAYLAVMWIAALVWTYRDAQSRTRDVFTQNIGLLLVLIFNLPGLLLYLVLRPRDTLIDMYDHQLEAEALLHEIQEQAVCPSCRRKVEPDFVACPYCRSALRSPCDACGRAIASTWVLCPYCGAERVEAAPAPAGRGAEAPAESSARVRRATTPTYTPPAKPQAPPDPAADAGA